MSPGKGGPNHGLQRPAFTPLDVSVIHRQDSMPDFCQQSNDGRFKPIMPRVDRQRVDAKEEWCSGQCCLARIVGVSWYPIRLDRPNVC